MSFTESLNSVDLELQNEFKERKLYTRFLHQSYARLHKNKADFVILLDFMKKCDNVKACASFLDFSHIDNGTVKLSKANFCKDKLCPMCAWRRSKKIYNQVHSCVDYMKNNYQFIMLTLTVRNVSSFGLSDAVDHLNRSFAKMLKYKAFKIICKGYLKCLEITYNRDFDTYHPHFHVLIAVDNNYFRSDYYLHQSDFLSMWQRATKDKSITQVDVRKIHYNANRSELSDISSAVAEVAKYAVKPADYIFPNNQVLTDVVVYTFSTVLHNRRLVGWGGCFADVRKLLGFDDAFEGDLLHTDDDKKDGEVIFISRYRWSHGKYKLYAIDYPEKLLIADPENDLIFDAETGELLE